jgi:phosphatidylserine decarboxylase
MKSRSFIHYFHSAGWPFIGFAVVLTAFLATLGCFPFVVGAVVTLWCAYFFRDPQRVAPLRPGLIVSPADGHVVGVEEVMPASDLCLDGGPRWRISIFLNIFDVHVNRIPVDGTVAIRAYRPGKFINAAHDKASEDNERMTLVLQMRGDHPLSGKTIGVVQIAGLIARRIICNAKEGDMFKAGERYGIIRFGSRADIYLPSGLSPLVAVGQYMIGGETVLADCCSSEAIRKGEQR